MKKQVLWDLCTSDASLVKTLKDNYEANQLYTRISDNILVSLAHSAPFDLTASLDYATEYKDTTGSISPLAPHLFQLINQVYLHMRRTGINQSILLQ